MLLMHILSILMKVRHTVSLPICAFGGCICVQDFIMCLLVTKDVDTWKQTLSGFQLWYAQPLKNYGHCFAEDVLLSLKLINIQGFSLMLWCRDYRCISKNCIFGIVKMIYNLGLGMNLGSDKVSWK